MKIALSFLAFVCLSIAANGQATMSEPDEIKDT
jgi:hypothetical protein